MSWHMSGSLLLCFTLLLFSNTNEYLLLQLKKQIAEAKEGKVWTLIHTAEQDYDQHYISSLPSYTHRRKELIEPAVVETTIAILSQNQCKVIASSLTKETKHHHSVLKCGDWESREFSCECILPNGDIANIVYSISYSFLHCGYISVHDKSGETKCVVSFNTNESHQKSLNKLFESFIDTTCYGNDCMNGYCFSFKKPGLIQVKESWEKMLKEREQKETAYREMRRIAELQHQFKCTLLPQLHHLNSFDSKTLALYKNMDSTASTNAIPHMISNLQMEAVKQNCTLHWSDIKKEFYFQVPEEIRPIYSFDK